MRVLIIGNGGREHAIAWSLSKDPHVSDLFIAPGNPGTGLLGTNLAVDSTDIPALCSLAVSYGIDLAVIGPEVPLIMGIADALAEVGVLVFGPNHKAAQIEGSKFFAKEVMQAAGVPTARSLLVDSPANLDSALDQFGPTWVVKNDGLAAGKGVVVTTDRSEARLHAATLLDEGKPVLLESFLDGPEVSLLCFVCDETVIPLIPAQDFKRVHDTDKGPNTGGMGAYAPLPWLTEENVATITATIVKPVAKELVQRHCPFRGILYAGLALGTAGFSVIEFNCRFGDPEAQAVLELLATPLAPILYDVASGNLDPDTVLHWKSGFAVALILAAQYYPGKPRIGDIITGIPYEKTQKKYYKSPATQNFASQEKILPIDQEKLENHDPLEQVILPEHGHIMHSATQINAAGELVTAGGRVLSVVTYAATLAQARTLAYNYAENIHFTGKHYRKDIAQAAAEGKITLAEIYRIDQQSPPSDENTEKSLEENGHDS